MPEQGTPAFERAALWGVALNPLMPMPDRLACALQALALYEAEVRKLRGVLRAGGTIIEENDE